MLSMIAHCLVVLGYCSSHKNGATMATTTAKVTAITEMVKGRMEAFPLNAIVGHPTLNYVLYLVDELTAFASHFVTS